MARKERKSVEADRLEGLLDAGDWRAARVEAGRLAASSDPASQAAAGRARERLRPGPTAILASAVGLVFLLVVAAVGLAHR